jgi:hypothetical protein
MSSASAPVEMARCSIGRLLAHLHDRALAELLLDLHRLGDRERQAAAFQQRQHDVLHRLVVDPEHQLPEQAAQPRLLVIEHRERAVVGVGLCRHADLDALDARREECDRRVADGIERGDPVGQQFGQARLGLSPRAQHPAPDDRRVGGPSGEVAQHRSRHHLAHLPRHAGHGVDDLLDGAVVDGSVVRGGVRPPHPAHDSGGSPGLLINEDAAGRTPRLREVVLGHVAAAGREHRGDDLGSSLVELQIDTGDRGDGPTRQIVLRRAETATADDCVVAIERLGDRRNDAVEVVAHLDLSVAVDPRRRELLADPRRVRIDDLAEQQFGPDRNHLGAHPGRLSGRRRPARMVAIPKHSRYTTWLRSRGNTPERVHEVGDEGAPAQGRLLVAGRHDRTRRAPRRHRSRHRRVGHEGLGDREGRHRTTPTSSTPSPGLTAEKHDSFLEPDGRPARHRRVRRQDPAPGRARRVELPQRRPARHLRGPRLHRVGRHQPRLHPREPERQHAVHPHRVRLVDRRGARQEDADPALPAGHEQAGPARAEAVRPHRRRPVVSYAGPSRSTS